MADIRLVGFPAKTNPGGSDIKYFGDASDGFREVRVTLDQDRTYCPRIEVVASQDIVSTFFGKNIINNSGAPIVLTIPVGAGFPVTSEFEMIRNAVGAFTLQAAAGVTINGVDGGSIVLDNEYDRLVATNIQDNEWTAIHYSGSTGSVSDYGEMWFQNNTDVTPNPGIGLPSKIAATYNNGQLSDNFIFFGGRLVYIGTENIFCKITASATLTTNLSSDEVSLQIIKDGFPIPKSVQSSFSGPISPANHNITVQCMTQFFPNDYIEMFVANEDSNNNITVSRLNASIHNI